MGTLLEKGVHWGSI